MRRGFTLLELAIVVAVIALVTAVAIPALSGAHHRADDARLHADTRQFQGALDRYAADHDGLSPAHDEAGLPCPDQSAFIARLLDLANAQGAPAGPGAYLFAIPPNPRTTCPDIALGPWDQSEDCRWRFDRDLAKVRPDHPGAINEHW